MILKELEPQVTANEKQAGYSIMPGYKQTEVGSIPEDWEECEIRAACKLINGRGFKPHEWADSGLPIIRIQNLNGSDEFNYFQGSFDPKIRVERSQLLFAWSGSRGTSFGPHIWQGQEAVLNYHTWKVVVNEIRVCPRFFYHALRQLTNHIEENAHGASALVHTQKWEMEAFKFPCPSIISEQKAIAEALGDADSLVEALEQMLAKKRNLKRATMQQLLTGKKRLPGFEGDWETKTIGDLFSVGGGFSASRDQLSHKGICYLHYGDIHGTSRSVIDVEHEQHSIPRLDVSLQQVGSASMLSDGDVVFVDASEDIDGTSRHIVIRNPSGIPFISGLHTIVAKPKTTELRQSYCRYCFQTEKVKSQFRYFAVGTKVSGVSKSNITKISISLPSTDEQTAIATVLSDLDVSIAAIEAKVEKARRIKAGMMRELLTGRTRLV
jgi:type I restriction enzyme S subunit